MTANGEDAHNELTQRWRRESVGVWRADGPVETEYVYDAVTGVLAQPAGGDGVGEGSWEHGDAYKRYAASILEADRMVAADIASFGLGD